MAPSAERTSAAALDVDAGATSRAASPTRPSTSSSSRTPLVLDPAAATDDAAARSFQELCPSTTASFDEQDDEVPWHMRAYSDGPRPIPPAVKASEKPRVPVEQLTERAVRMMRGRDQYWIDVHGGKREPRKKKPRCEKPEPLRLVDWTQRDQSTLERARCAIEDDYARCPCVQCTILRRESSPLGDFRCPMRWCNLVFSDFLELFEHQTRVHGTINPNSRRMRADLYRQEHGTAPFPPTTVYTGQQVLNPAYRPTEWTFERIELEHRTLRSQLLGKQYVFRGLQAWDSFVMAYHHVRLGGVAQLQAQYKLALEYYESSLVHQVDTRTFRDGADTVGSGRNWLALAPELERARHATPFRFELEKEPNAFALRSDSEDDSDSEEDDEDDSGDGGEEDNEAEEAERSKAARSLLLRETGTPIVFSAAAAAATKAKLTASVPLLKQFVAPSQRRTASRKRRRGVPHRCALCTQPGHGWTMCPDRRHDTVIVRKRKVLEPLEEGRLRRRRKCSKCGQNDHTRQFCTERVAIKSVRCSHCGLRGHNKFRCRQVSLANVQRSG